MSRSNPNDYRCDACMERVAPAALVRVMIPHPSKSAEVALHQCPLCGEAGSNGGFTMICDEPGCTRDACCGWPTADKSDYRNTCHEHSQIGAIQP